MSAYFGPFWTPTVIAGGDVKTAPKAALAALVLGTVGLVRTAQLQDSGRQAEIAGLALVRG